MPSRLQFQTNLTDAEKRKRRQEKFRKRKRSLFNKVRLLAKDTDAWVALVVRDRAGQVQSFRSSESFNWPSSIKDLIKKHPSGTHEFLEKHAIPGCWKEVAEDESDSALVDGDTDSFVEDVQARRMTSVEMEVGSDNTITANQYQVGKEVEAGANALNDKTIETVEPQKLAVDVLRELDSTLVAGLRELDGTTVDVHGESDYTNVDALGELDNLSVDSLRTLYNATLDSDREPGSTVFEHGESHHMTVDGVRESNDTILDAPIELDNVTVCMLGDLDNAKDVLQESMAMDVLNTTEVNPTTSEYDMLDLDMPEVKSRIEMEAREGESIEAANALHMKSQYRSPPTTSGGLGSWQVVNWPRMTRQDGRQGWGSTGIDPKKLLEGWDWVFQKQLKPH